MPQQGHCGSEVKEGADEEIYNFSARIESAAFIYELRLHKGTGRAGEHFHRPIVQSIRLLLCQTLSKEESRQDLWNPSVHAVPVHVSSLGGEK